MAEVVEEALLDAAEEEILEEIEDELEEEEDEFVGVGGVAEIKLFGKWSYDDIEVRDISLVVRINKEE
jgi:small subunit ribosomal protein S5e